MDQIMGKVGSYWVGQKAKGEVASVNNEINKVSNSVDNGTKWLVGKVKGTIQKPLPELLKEFDMAIGIFPADITGYNFNQQTGYLTVTVASPCEVSYTDSSILRFATEISGYLEKGKFTNIEGMKTKVMLWVKVTNIAVDGAKLYVTAGKKKTRSRDAYELSRAGMNVNKF